MPRIVLIAHNVRSVHNVGSLLRTAECLGLKDVYLTGYTPYPKVNADTRLPHETERLHRQIHKTALGAEELLHIHRFESLEDAIGKIRTADMRIVALEQNDSSMPLPHFKPTTSTAILVGNEVDGLAASNIKLCDATIEIPMLGKKESLNVVQAAGMALYQAVFWKNMLE